MFVKRREDETAKEGIAQLWGPTFTESNTECLLAFWAYLSQNLTLYPTMHHVELDLITNLEKLDSVVMVEDDWNRVEIGLGRQRARFQIGFNLVYLQDEEYSAGIAVDDIEIFGCALPARQDECGEEAFHCTVSGACVQKEKLCDYADDCGDLSDEVGEQCMTFTRIDFENSENPLGFFQQHSENADFKWKLGQGSDSLDDGVGPPFDHTMADPTGHYLFVDVNEHEANNKARILSPNITTETVGCFIRFFYHMHGVRNGQLAMLKLSEGHEDKLWQAPAVDGVDQNIWKRVNIGFSDSAKAFSLAIEATVGTKERGNIAIDDITFTPQCKFGGDDSATTTSNPHGASPWECNFNSGDCGYAVMTNEESFKWRITSTIPYVGIQGSYFTSKV